MSMLAAIRPDSWDLPLFLHILGAMVLVGALTLSATSLMAAWKSGSPALSRLGYMSLFYGALPGFIVTRGAAEWIADKEGLNGDDVDLSWIDIGYMVSDMGFLLLIVAMVIGGLGVRRINRGETPSLTSVRIVTGLVSLVLIGYLVAVWAMTTKPV
jgi:hypothetical protein